MEENKRISQRSLRLPRVNYADSIFLPESQEFDPVDTDKEDNSKVEDGNSSDASYVPIPEPEHPRKIAKPHLKPPSRKRKTPPKPPQQPSNPTSLPLATRQKLLLSILHNADPISNPLYQASGPSQLATLHTSISLLGRLSPKSQVFLCPSKFPDFQLPASSIIKIEKVLNSTVAYLKARHPKLLGQLAEQLGVKAKEEKKDELTEGYLEEEQKEEAQEEKQQKESGGKEQQIKEHRKSQAELLREEEKKRMEREVKLRMILAKLATNDASEYWCRDSYNYWCVAGNVVNAHFNMDYLGIGNILSWIQTKHYYYTMIRLHEMEDRKDLMELMIIFSLIVFDNQINFFRAQREYYKLISEKGITIDTDEKDLRSLIPKKTKNYNNQHCMIKKIIDYQKAELSGLKKKIVTSINKLLRQHLCFIHIHDVLPDSKLPQVIDYADLNQQHLRYFFRTHKYPYNFYYNCLN